MEQLQGKTAFVTGAGRGIGRAVAVAYAREGMHVACIARSSGELEAVVGEIEASGGSAAGIACDVTDFARLSEAAESVYTLWGRMDVAVINAGIDCENRPVEELDADEMEARTRRQPERGILHRESRHPLPEEDRSR